MDSDLLVDVFEVVAIAAPVLLIIVSPIAILIAGRQCRPIDDPYVLMELSQLDYELGVSDVQPPDLALKPEDGIDDDVLGDEAGLQACRRPLDGWNAHRYSPV